MWGDGNEELRDSVNLGHKALGSLVATGEILGATVYERLFEKQHV